MTTQTATPSHPSDPTDADLTSGLRYTFTWTTGGSALIRCLQCDEEIRVAPQLAEDGELELNLQAAHARHASAKHPKGLEGPSRVGYRVRCSQQRTPGIDTGSYVGIAWPEVPTLEAAREQMAALKAEPSEAPRRNWAIFRITYSAKIECVEQDA